MTFSTIKTLALAAGALYLAGCAGTLIRPVAEEDKDPTFQYDGVYKATIDHPGGGQQIDQWTFNCAPRKTEFQFAVRESVVDMGTSEDGTQNIGYVNKDGKFRVPIATDAEIRAAGNSDSSIDAGAITIILQGQLTQPGPFGFYVDGVKQFNNRGCTYRMDFEKL